MHVLDVIVRFMMLPFILVAIAVIFIPSVIRDIKEWSRLFIAEDKKEKKRKTVRSHAAATANPNSFKKNFNYPTGILTQR